MGAIDVSADADIGAAEVVVADVLLSLHPAMAPTTTKAAKALAMKVLIRMCFS
ncbi:hypothetical protein [Gordonia sputi]|uniref:hypothetical protein n=1 Tax=Gordonia sputi TaxID=36823 RepID=UPI00227001E0|nr:hypothetical protein [Gordonia sputi]